MSEFDSSPSFHSDSSSVQSASTRCQRSRVIVKLTGNMTQFGTDPRHQSRSSADRYHDDTRDGSFHFTTAIVCRVSNSLADHTSFDRQSSDGVEVDIERCRTELEQLVQVLRYGAGLDVVELPSDEQQPDGLFVGDIAVVIGGVALICNPPTLKTRPSRNGEKAVVRQVLRKELGMKIVEVDSDEAVVEAGDVLWTGREIFVGLSSRTNIQGAQAVAKAFPEYSTSVVRVYPPAVHLKDHINVVQPEVFVVCKSLAAQRTFREIRQSGGSGYQYISVNDEQAADVIYTNRTLIRVTNDQIPTDAQVYADKLNCRQLEVRINEILKRGKLSNCVILVNRARKTRRFPGYSLD